jgi:putative membrane protein insertion efficiency factor
VKRASVVRSVVMRIIRGYQVYLSPLKRPSCRFLPTCSEYAREAVELHGVGRGLLLTAWRLLRCQPLCRGGFDPVLRSTPSGPQVEGR